MARRTRPALVLALSMALAAPVVSGQEPGPPVKFTKNRDFLQHLSWSPDGNFFLVTRIHAGQMSLWTLRADGSDWKRVLPSYAQPHFDGHWHPDGQRVVFVLDRLQGTDGKLQIDAAGVDGSDQKTLIPHRAFEESPRWSPDRKRLAWVSTRDGNQDVWVADAEGKDTKKLTSDPAADNNPSWSPDGKHIAFCSGRKGGFDIYVMNADGGDVRRLTDHRAMDYWPVWSPDGKRIAFTSNRDGNYELYVVNADGTGLRNVTNHPAQDNYAAWSPDGRRLAFISNRGGGYNVFMTSVE